MPEQTNRTSYYRLLLAGPPLVFLGVFYFFPLSQIFGLSFFSDGTWDPDKLKKLMGSSYYVRALWFTTWQAAVSTILTLAAALPASYVFARYRFRGKSILLSLATVPFVLPTVVAAAAFQALLGPRGLFNGLLMGGFGLSAPPIDIDQTIWFILLAHVFYNYSVVLRLVGGFWSRLEPSLSETAQMLGASSWRTFWQVTLPLLRPAIAAASLLVFVFCFCSFGVILILGGPRFATIEVEIFRQAVHLFNLPLAAALSLIQILFTFVLMRGYTWIERRSAVALYPEATAITQRRAVGPVEKLILWTNLGFTSLLMVTPLLALVQRSFFTRDGYSLRYYRALFENPAQSIFYVPPVQAVANSLLFAMIALVLALVIGALAAYFLAGPKKRLTAWLDPLFMLPLSTSAVTLGFGFIVALDEPPLNLRTSLALTPLAHTLVAFPFVVRSLLPALRSIPSSLRESAALLGASPWRVWRHVDLPIVGRALAVGAVFAFTVSMGEFGATVFTARPQTPTMPLAIYRFLGQPGAVNYGQAMAMSSLLMLVTAIGFLFLEKIRLTPGREY